MVGVFSIREEFNRVFVVLRYGDMECVKALPIGVKTWTDEQTRRHIEKLVTQMMEISGVEKIKLGKIIDESLH